MPRHRVNVELRIGLRFGAVGVTGDFRVFINSVTPRARLPQLRKEKWTAFARETWLILPVVICLSQRLSHACLSISISKAKLRMAH